MANCYDFNQNAWDLGLRRDPNDWEVGELLHLLVSLGSIQPVQDRPDKWV